MSYSNTIEMSKKDLMTFSMDDLLLLAKYTQTTITRDKSRLAERIAIKLLPKYSEMPRGDLPYGGDYARAILEGDNTAKQAIINWFKNATDAELIALKAQDLPYGASSQVAMSNRDNDAIRVIFRWNALTEPLRRKQLISEEKDVPDEAKDCSNVISFIDQEDWTPDHLPDIRITLLDPANPEGGPKRTLCYQRENLEKIVGDRDNLYYIWIPNQAVNVGSTFGEPKWQRQSDNVGMESEGYGGGPSTQPVLLIPDDLYIVGDTLDLNVSRMVGIPVGSPRGRFSQLS